MRPMPTTRQGELLRVLVVADVLYVTTARKEAARSRDPRTQRRAHKRLSEEFGEQPGMKPRSCLVGWQSEGSGAHACGAAGTANPGSLKP